jgi:hypothetical protein
MAPLEAEAIRKQFMQCEYICSAKYKIAPYPATVPGPQHVADLSPALQVPAFSVKEGGLSYSENRILATISGTK